MPYICTPEIRKDTYNAQVHSRKLIRESNAQVVKLVDTLL